MLSGTAAMKAGGGAGYASRGSV